MPPERTSSPLTDPRALLGSSAFHAVLLVLVTLAAARLAIPPRAARPANVIQAELGPVDNRAPAEVGGGSSGELGGVTPEPSIMVAPSAGRTADAALDRLTAEALPLGRRPSTAAGKSPAGAGTGVLPGSGLGGGGGEGGGSGGGKGRGIGPKTEFFGARAQGLSFVYVIDRSGSMLQHHALDRAKAELLASVETLPPDAKFGVLFYNLDVASLTETDGRPAMLPATAAHVESVRTRLREVSAEGGTSHVTALAGAFALRPDVVFFLSDARQLNAEQAESLIAQAGKTAVQAVEFGDGPDPGSNDPLKTLSAATGGAYRYVDVTAFDRKPGAERPAP